MKILEYKNVPIPSVKDWIKKQMPYSLIFTDYDLINGILPIDVIGKHSPTLNQLLLRSHAVFHVTDTGYVEWIKVNFKKDI